MVVTPEEATQIERQTRNQSESERWIVERRSRITASVVGGIIKMRSTTKKSKKVENLLYSKFRGNAATRYGAAMEQQTIQEYLTYQQQHGRSNLTVDTCGLFVSMSWLAATPDGIVRDPNSSSGLIEKKSTLSTRSHFD